MSSPSSLSLPPHSTKCPWCGLLTAGRDAARKDNWCDNGHHYSDLSALIASISTADSASSAKEPRDTTIKERNKTASNPPADQYPNPSGGGPASSPNPDNPTTQNIPIDTTYVGSPPDYSAQQWFMGKRNDTSAWVLDHDEKTGLAKWPLSFKVIEYDFKRPNKPLNRGQEPATTPNGAPDKGGETSPPSIGPVGVA